MKKVLLCVLVLSSPNLLADVLGFQLEPIIGTITWMEKCVPR